MRLILVLSVVASGIAAACMPASPGIAQTASARQCFSVNEVESFSAIDGRHVRLRTSRDEVFELTTIGCPNLDHSIQVGVASRGLSQWVCSPMDAELVVPDALGGPASCAVTSVRQLTADEVAALDAAA